MTELTYEKLKRNIAEEEVLGDMLSVTFKCPVTEKIYHAVAMLRPASPMSHPLETARRGFRNLLGNMFHGERGETTTANHDREAIERAGVEAFEAVSSHFAWDESRKAFVDAATAEMPLSDFDRQLHDHPLTGDWERNVAARMLAEIAAADGTVTPTEREFFEGFLNSEMGPLDQLVKRGKLSKLDLEECRPASRATLLMLANAIAMTDEHLDADEQARLAEYGKAFGVSLEREELIRHWAAEKVVENMLYGCYADGRLNDEERTRIEQLAGNIGINQALVAKIDVRVRKRLGAK
ncbi:MAG: TerB family tellurite resistance protein [Planctomycetes bacterium]|nr:TerB family tellurite resistance protein [Planctomycetota bacterium]MCB9936286.1 TerB family tellurite resistance protein [Planctomycetota bacterium]